MSRNKKATLVLAALALLNLLVGGLMGFILIRGENKLVFTYLFFIFMAAAVVTLFCDWMTLRQAEAETEYKVLKLRKWRFVREPRKMERDNDGLRALQMGLSGWAFSLLVPLLAMGLIWPETFWLLSFRVVAALITVLIALAELVVEIIIVRRKMKKGEPI